MENNWLENKMNEYSKEKLIEYGIVLLENERPIKTLPDLAGQFCCLTECKNCPVYIHNYNKRTEYEKEVLHEPCVTNLYKWIIEEAKKTDED